MPFRNSIKILDRAHIDNPELILSTIAVHTVFALFGKRLEFNIHCGLKYVTYSVK